MPAWACFSRMSSRWATGVALTPGEVVATAVVLIPHQRLECLITCCAISGAVVLAAGRPVDAAAAGDAVVVVGGVGEGRRAAAPRAHAEARQRPFPAADGVFSLAERRPGARPVAPDAVDQVAADRDLPVGALAQGERRVVLFGPDGVAGDPQALDRA